MSTCRLRIATLLTIVLLVILSAARTTRGDVTYPTRPTDDNPIADEAAVLSPADAEAVRAMTGELRKSNRIPIAVCTISSLADHAAATWPIDRYALNLFDEWGVGSSTANQGILLVVSKGDHKARIQLGAGFDRSFDAKAQLVMDSVIVPRFKADDLSGGVRAGVEGLARVVRNQSLLPVRADSPATSPVNTRPISVPPARLGSHNSFPWFTVSIVIVIICVSVYLTVRLILALNAHNRIAYKPIGSNPAASSAAPVVQPNQSDGGFWSGLGLGWVLSGSSRSSGASSISDVGTFNSGTSTPSDFGSSLGDSGSSFGGGSSDGGGASGSW